MRLLLAFATVSALQGCTILRIESSSDRITVSREFGALYVSVADAGRAHTATLTSLGITNTPMGFSLGYSRQTWVQMPDDACRLVLWVDDPELLPQVKHLMAQIPQACVIASSNKESEK